MGSALDWVIVGGLCCGVLAGGAARFGRLCTMSAVEDALVGRDWRGMKAWGLAVAVAIAATQTLALLEFVDLSLSRYSGNRIHVLGTMLGGAVFGLGMTLVGTCSFGLLVRAGGGDLRAGVCALIVGIVAIAMTAGLLAPLRRPLLEIGVVDVGAAGGPSISGMAGAALGPAAAIGVVFVLVAALIAVVVTDVRLRKRRRLITGAVLMGLAVAGGWVATTYGVATMVLDRTESLSFVAPVGRGLSQFMMDAFRNAQFGIAAALGVVAASCAVAHWKGEFRWEAFDDALEMRRHLLGGALMGIGGVLAQGCTIGQGLSAASTLSITAPLFIASVLVGARLGLAHLLEGRSMWRIGG